MPTLSDDTETRTVFSKKRLWTEFGAPVQVAVEARSSLMLTRSWSYMSLM